MCRIDRLKGKIFYGGNSYTLIHEHIFPICCGSFYGDKPVFLECLKNEHFSIKPSLLINVLTVTKENIFYLRIKKVTCITRKKDIKLRKEQIKKNAYTHREKYIYLN